MYDILRAAAVASFIAGAALSGFGAPARAQTPAPASSPAAVVRPVSTPAGTLPPPSPSPLPAATVANPPENTLVTAHVRDEFVAWQRGRIDRHHYSPQAGGIYIDALVGQVQPELAAIGPVVSLQYRTASLLLGDLVYRYDVTGTTGVMSVLYSLDAQGKTDGIVFTPQIFRSAAPEQ